MEYQEKRAFHCLHARADIPSGVQKYPKTTRVNKGAHGGDYHHMDEPRPTSIMRHNSFLSASQIFLQGKSLIRTQLPSFNVSHYDTTY